MHAITEKGLLVAVLFGGFGGGPLWAAESLTGTYTLRGAKGAITLVLNQEANGKVSGSLNGGDLALVLKGMSQPTGVVVGATATAQGQFASYFQVTRVGDQVAFDLIGSNAKNEPDLSKTTRITFPLTAPGAPTLAAGSTAPADSKTQPQGGPGRGAEWIVYKHPTGLSMRHPPDWKLTQLPTALQLVPPNVAMNAAGAAEAYFVLAEGAQGIASPEDPRIVQYFGQEMAKFAPFLRPSGSMERIRAGSAPGILLAWDGTSPAGIVVRARMFITILKGYALAVLALGDRGKLAERDDAVRGMFSSFAAGVGEKDPHLVGAWKFWSYSSSADGRYGSTTDRRFVLQADGACFWSDSSESSGSFSGRNSLGETTWTAGLAGQNQGGVKRGQWSAGNGALHVLWDDGSGSRWDYQVGGVPGNRRLNLKGGGAKPDEWVEGR